MELHSGKMSNGLYRLVHPVVRTGPVKDPHLEQAKEDRIVNTSPINPLKPFHPSDHVCLKLIVKEQIREDVPPPPVVNNTLVVWFILLDYPMEGILGDLYPFR